MPLNNNKFSVVAFTASYLLLRKLQCIDHVKKMTFQYAECTCSFNTIVQARGTKDTDCNYALNLELSVY